ncbi:MAG: four helix bundle protein [Candidatus Nealsonbacteria bacterium CG_4_10_14_0_2_um_filter_39_15]|uniref:Four helix bundle protein n=1 Tax=Candidatus Nealsonbacteria bacterium CG_4_10_14_0_2_um_filter_39_15 TaxID=1974681 RepID=A0A2M7UW49_9BACT|nr:MAG: hypothetical protein COV69_04400 [Parcubacteria group bacterium CG11_big_fil_rev_8_21_14_0_20_39_14]PIS35376.1 MAG: four helix bundle protein [Parcubacteria group bacterium CG08_land_8_20_14_0_20_38_56]PIZ88186.1 MAG: four helix bundle protein [Candidatus Nealsonbacteria bacterium CG_4_10_14_0_2_um_filter_39_15]
MPTDEELEKYKKPDGTIDWGKYATDQLSAINYQSSKQKEAKSLEELSIFRISDQLSDSVWDIVSKWDYFAKKTIGEQWVRATDSIAANITEGYGRYFFGEYIVFLYYARGSLYESMFWLEKAHKRLLINDYLYRELKEKFDKLPIEINKVIKVVKSEAYKWKGRPKY